MYTCIRDTHVQYLTLLSLHTCTITQCTSTGLQYTCTCTL